MKLIDKYLVRQFVFTFLFILGIVLVICLVVDFVEKFDKLTDNNAPVEQIAFSYYPSFLFSWGNLLAPICVFLAVIFFTSRMAGRTELIPVLSAGVSFYRVLAPYVLVAVVMAGASFYLKSFLVPNSTAERLEFEYQYLNRRHISSNKNVHKKVAEDTYVYMSYFNNRKAEGHNFCLERFDGDKIRTKIRCRRVQWIDSTQSWLLKDKVEIRHIDSLEERLIFRDEVDTTFLLTPDDIYVKEEWAASMTLPDLLQYIELEEMRGSDILRELYIERHRRFSDPVAIVILTLIGFAMSSRKRRGGIALQIGLGLLICFIYIAFLIAGQSLVSEEVPIWIGVWFPNFVFLPLAIFLLAQAPK
mgnify:CR=1 FL=1